MENRQVVEVFDGCSGRRGCITTDAAAQEGKKRMMMMRSIKRSISPYFCIKSKLFGRKKEREMGKHRSQVESENKSFTSVRGCVSVNDNDIKITVTLAVIDLFHFQIKQTNCIYPKSLTFHRIDWFVVDDGLMRVSLLSVCRTVNTCVTHR